MYKTWNMRSFPSFTYHKGICLKSVTLNKLPQSLLDSMKVFLLKVDLNGQITYMNNFASQSLGLDVQDAIGMNFVGTFAEKGSIGEKAFLDILGRVAGANGSNGCDERLESSCVNSKGKHLNILWSICTTGQKGKDEAGLDDNNGAGLLLSGMDISEQISQHAELMESCNNLREELRSNESELIKANEFLRQEINERKWAEDVLRRSDEKYRLVVEHANEGIVIIQDNYFKYFNPKTLKVLNYSEEILKTCKVDDLIHPDDRDRAFARRLKIIKGEPVEAIHVIKAIDQYGAIRWLESNTVLIIWMGRPAILSFLSNITERKRAEDEILQSQERLRTLATELSLAEEQERRRLANNLHDHIGQSLAIMKIKLGALREVLAGNGMEEEYDYIKAVIERTIRHTKNLTFQLSPPELYTFGFEATVESLGEQVQKEHKISFMFLNEGGSILLDKDVSVLMFQAVRELLMNIIKHAEASRFSISILRNQYDMQIVVEDDGKGFNTSSVGLESFGFFSIKERLSRFGGQFTVESIIGRGTRVFLTAPIDKTGALEISG